MERIIGWNWYLHNQLVYNLYKEKFINHHQSDNKVIIYSYLEVIDYSSSNHLSNINADTQKPTNN